jgi:CheY-like chemotaxis protein
MCPNDEIRFGSRPATNLVVEDEILIRMDISQELARAGYAVIEATNAAEGLAILDAGHAVDLIFSDVRMPGPIDGLGLLGIVRQRFQSIPVVLTSGHASLDEVAGVRAQIRREERDGVGAAGERRAERSPR